MLRAMPLATPQPPPVESRPPPPPAPSQHDESTAERAALPAAGQAPPAHGQIALLLAYLGAGLLLLAIGALFEGSAGVVVRLIGPFLCCHAAIVAASWLPAGVLSRRLDTFLDRWVGDIGGGFYGLMALAMFVRLEVDAVYQEVTGFDFSAGAIGGAVLPWVIGFSLDSLLNSIKAAIWLPYLFGQIGLWGTAATVGMAWGLFAFGSRVFPQPAFLRETRASRRARRKQDS